jgi:adenosine deaminase
MVEEGVNVTLGSDDPTMFHTDQGNEYVRFVNELGFTAGQAVDVSLAAIDGSWLSEPEKKSLHAQFDAELTTLRSQFGI